MIRGFTGLNGSGKSLMAIELCVVPALLAGRSVLTNLHLFPPEKEVVWAPLLGRKLPREAPAQVVRLTELAQLLAPPVGTLVLLDEIATVFPSRAWSSMPGQIHAGLQQLRKRSLDLIWTAPSWSRADVTLREITLEVTQCRALLRRRSLPWAPARFVLSETWDDPTEYVSGKSRQSLVSRSSTLRRVKGTVASRIYETTEPVETLLVHVLGEGVCLECGGSKRRPACSCGGHGGGSVGGRGGGGLGSLASSEGSLSSVASSPRPRHLSGRTG